MCECVVCAYVRVCVRLSVWMLCACVCGWVGGGVGEWVGGGGCECV